MKLNNANTKRSDIFTIDPNDIVVKEGFNVRKDFELDELKEQIKLHGVLNPITVVPFKDENGDEKYRLVDGERRYRATLLAIKEGAAIDRIKAIFLPRNSKEEDLLVEQMMRNEGKNFTVYEQGLMFARFRDEFGYNQKEIAEKFGKSAVFVGNCLALLKLPADVQEKVQNNEISISAVRQIADENKGDDSAIQKAVDSAINEAKSEGKDTATAKHITGETKSQKEFKTIGKGFTTLFFALKKEKLEDRVMEMTVRDLISYLDCSQSMDDVINRIANEGK